MTVTNPEPRPPSLEELLATGPFGVQQEERQPIGVPPGYTVTRPGEEIRVEGIGWRPGMPTVIPPTFFEGDEYLPAQQSPEDRARLQMMMFDLGILDRDFQAGVWDGPSRLAWRGVLEFANAAGITDPMAALRQYGQQFDAAARAKMKRAPLVIRKSNPDDLRRVFRDAAAQALGEAVSDEEVDRMVSAYHGREASYQRQAWDATYEGGTVTEPPSADTFATEQLERTRPVETGAYEVADRVVGDFLSLVQGPFDG